ncbi:8-oxo-dGTP pyrophosphatase MutT (NUDIX family) [Actinoplanes octamycinicus]|uniref:8-oxo-dGTP pyrophosphatase MutT (NUDIX family) n=1 Tax=Actinoplanes octamycinicus TaxID=135948 RepID=A0A7W7H2T0_9ACTN|nr:NUDIX domain-containing protein [Actinoplanes octamycinicus]MBB4742627.1 8-oxo-dGTP pyrophosphatase MutT (NUDIX family) [Actinoplanes octamycinicus]GIE60965.1 hypothetical protein Aoc01nite_63670 [Actinoplanes octamycinicus]
MEANDIDWSGPQGSFKLRAAGVVSDGERVLVCAVDGIDGWFLPGGRVRFGEDSAAGLRRELWEELGVRVSVDGGPLLVAEGIRDAGGVIHQEVCFYYPVAWPERVPPEPVTGRDGNRFRWVRFDDLAGLPFLPPEILGVLTGRVGGLRHVCFDRRAPRPAERGKSPDHGGMTGRRA